MYENSNITLIRLDSYGWNISDYSNPTPAVITQENNTERSPTHLRVALKEISGDF